MKRIKSLENMQLLSQMQKTIPSKEGNGTDKHFQKTILPENR